MSPPVALSLTSVRLAEPEDVPRLADLEADATTRETVAENPAAEDAATEDPAADTLIVVGHPAAGFARVSRHDARFHLHGPVVDPARRGLGMTGMLLRAAYGIVLDAGGDRLSVTPGSERAARWYAGQGFVAGVTAARGPELTRTLVDGPTPIPAVSVLPVRDGRAGLEAFVQHRVSTMDFAAGAVVFPGGRIDPGDREFGATLDLPAGLLDAHVHAWRDTAYRRLGDAPEAARTLLATALREVAEETGARIDPTRLIPWDDWETPVGVPKRFDVRFFLLPVTSEREAEAFGHTTTEAHRSQWTPVADVATGAEDGSLIVVPPTRVLVDELCALDNLADAAALRPPITLVRHDLVPTPARRGRLTPTPGRLTPTRDPDHRGETP